MTATEDKSFEKVRNQARDYLSGRDAEEVKSTIKHSSFREKHGLLPREFQIVDQAHEDEVNAYIAERRTWRQKVYLLDSFEYWRLRAQFYPYIQRSDEKDNFFLRGISCHPRLSDYPMCKTVIQDYFICRDRHPFMQVMNMCAPLKEQFCACINEVFVKNHERGDKLFNAHRDEYFAEQRSKRFAKVLSQVEESVETKHKLQD